MLNKKKHSKDAKGVGYDADQCSTSKDSSSKQIHFTSSCENGKGKTFTVSKAIEKKTYVAATKRKHAHPKGKSKVHDGGFLKVKHMRKISRRPSYDAQRRPMRNNFNNYWYVYTRKYTNHVNSSTFTTRS